VSQLQFFWIAKTLNSILWTKKTHSHSLRPCLQLVLRCVLVTSRWGTHIPVSTWCFNPCLLSTFNHFCPDFFEGRVYGWENVWVFFRSFDQMNKISLHSLHMNMTGDNGKTYSVQPVLRLSEQKRKLLLSVSMLEIRNGERTLCLVRFSSSNQTALQLTKFESRLASTHLPYVLGQMVESSGSFSGGSITFDHISVSTTKTIRSNAFLTTSGRGQNWTSSKHFTPRLHLYLASSTFDPVD